VLLLAVLIFVCLFVFFFFSNWFVGHFLYTSLVFKSDVCSLNEKYIIFLIILYFSQIFFNKIYLLRRDISLLKIKG
jgi:hypothetical protein